MHKGHSLIIAKNTSIRRTADAFAERWCGVRSDQQARGRLAAGRGGHEGNNLQGFKDLNSKSNTEIRSFLYFFSSHSPFCAAISKHEADWRQGGEGMKVTMLVLPETRLQGYLTHKKPPPPRTLR